MPMEHLVGECRPRPDQGRPQAMERNAPEARGRDRQARTASRSDPAERGGRGQHGRARFRWRRSVAPDGHRPSMTPLRQLEANRQNARRSTGPRTDEGKLQSRRNALRHGLTAETVIEVLEDIEDYKAFEATIIADYDACTAVERELVLRLASLLWRIRRATAIETDLLRIQAEILRDQHHAAAINHDNEHPQDSMIHSALR